MLRLDRVSSIHDVLLNTTGAGLAALVAGHGQRVVSPSTGSGGGALSGPWHAGQ
ncbi:hypothetical protein RMN56_02400 [Micromonospora halotolerans]|uniref:Uncharacterized protein n=1 Tax=Micromonospora halotolerans TaxID=709879 RepID=A0ABY9ZYS6_9ACTN|nr:hypothetical protein [Micromonospora halotolerans]WNM40237.1 hypothetical protein RMN56_02400 [Micromonospora halotolerans]